MLHWILGDLRKQAHLPRAALAASCIIHACVCYTLFFVQTVQPPLVIKMGHIPAHAKVVYRPLTKRTHNKVHALTQTAPIVPIPKVATPAKSKPVSTPKAAPKLAPKRSKTVLASTKPPTTIAKKIIPKPAAPVKKEAPAPELASAQTPPEPIPEEMILELGRDDLALYEHMLAMQNAIQSVWAPPPGLPETTHCTMHIKISRQGNVTATMLKSSGVLVYDVSARQATTTLTAAKNSWGREYTIIF